jgi:rhodanese-related sulfurtransferase/DNA-binding transcriptional ArsR family regulator
MADRRAKDALYEAFASTARALGSGRRAELVDVLEQGERHVEELADEIDQSVANTSFHLRGLAAAGLVTSRRDGNRVYYALASDEIGDLWRCLRDVAAHHRTEVDDLANAYLGDRSSLEAITRSELLERLGTGAVTLIDVRPSTEFDAGHIASALSIPLDDLASSIASLPEGSEFVAYCRGRYCAFADEAVRLLHAHGRRARRLEDGYPEWRRHGFPVTRTLGSPA